MKNFIYSSKSHPCPVCGRTKDGDCRTSQDGRFVLCHTHTDRTQKEELNGFIYVGAAESGNWGKWLEKSEDWQKQRPVGKEFHYPFTDLEGKTLVEEIRVYTKAPDGSSQKDAWMRPAGVDTQKLVPYRYSEALDLLRSNKEPLLLVEGPPKVEALRKLGINATTFANGFQARRDSKWFEGFEDRLVVVPDQDKPGLDKANRILKAYPMARILKPWPDSCWWDPEWLPEKNGKDIADWIQQGATRDQILAAIAERPQTKPAELDPDEALRLELLALAAETDPIKLARKRAAICTTHHLSKTEIDDLLLYVQTASSRRERRSVTLNEALNRESQGLNFLLPGLIPRGEMVILAAAPKVGKTNLATELMHAVLTGGSVLNESAVPGRVLFVSTDESSHTTQRRLTSRGFDLLSHLSDNFRLLENFDIRELPILEEELAEFRPDLVVIDSLTGITVNSNIPEKDAEFGKIVYRLKDAIGRHGAASILIHHENKDREAKGINKIRGSSLLTAAAHSIWQLSYQTPDNESDPRRILKIKSRESDAIGYSLQINPYDLWSSQGIFECFGELDDEANAQKGMADRVLNHIAKYQGKGLTVQEINAHLSLGRGIYQILTRLENRRQITKRRCSIDPKRWVYALPIVTVESQENVTDSSQNSVTPPPPSPLLSVSFPATKKIAETTTSNGFDGLQHSFNTHSTPIQQGGSVEQGVEQDQTLAGQAFEGGIQHFQQKKGGRGGNSSENSPENLSVDPTGTLPQDPYRIEW